jgi:prophage regulatory protein
LNELPDWALLRLKQIIGDPKADPPIPPIIPVSKSTWWDGVRTGRFPKPVKLGPHTTAWRVEDIRALIEQPAALSVSFILPIDDRLRLTADDRCWRIEQRRATGEWRPVEYYPTIQGAVNSLAHRLVRTSEASSLADALAAVENVSRTLTQALASQFQVERRP